MEFARQKLQAKIDFYTTETDVCAELREGSGTLASYDARHVPQSGVYYGEPAGAAVAGTAKKPSSTLIYVEFEDNNLRERVENDRVRYIEKYGGKLSAYSVIEIAWNFKREGAALKSVPGQTSMITETAKYLSSLNVPILLRVGAEMNVWTTPADPNEFKEAFRSIAKIMRVHAPNVALVWYG
ncbi:MAG: hypothetical protein LBB94_06060 [Clostridiales bacterium]|jgi:hypothetical protein|nr:hypothetical protein [Clostridiales bacterium]